MRWYIAVGAVVLVLVSSPTWACGDVDLFCKANGAIDNWISDKSHAAGQGAVDAIQPVINEVMSQQIPTIINDLNTAVNNRIISAKDGCQTLKP